MTIGKIGGKRVRIRFKVPWSMTPTLKQQVLALGYRWEAPYWEKDVAESRLAVEMDRIKKLQPVSHSRIPAPKFEFDNFAL